MNTEQYKNEYSEIKPSKTKEHKKRLFRHQKSLLRKFYPSISSRDKFQHDGLMPRFWHQLRFLPDAYRNTPQRKSCSD